MAYNWKPPQITELTIEQQSALNDPNSISVAGGPGTGKSVVALWRHIRNYDIGHNNSLLLTYTKTLEHYLRISASQINTEAGKAVGRTLDWLFNHPTERDEIIIDEAQDLGEDVNIKLKNYSTKISYGADDQQILDPKRATGENRLREIFSTTNYPLSENFRNSFEILSFCSAFFPLKLISFDTLTNLRENNRRGNKPIVVKTNSSNNRQPQAISDILSLFQNDISSGTHNLAILVPLKRDVEKIKDLINNLNLGLQFSYYYEGVAFTGIENIHITTFKSAKGLEFDTVIIPDFQNYDWNIANLTLAPITENDYYVAMTRARRNLYLITTSIHSNLLGDNQSSTYTIETY